MELRTKTSANTNHSLYLQLSTLPASNLKDSLGCTQTVSVLWNFNTAQSGLCQISRSSDTRFPLLFLNRGQGSLLSDIKTNEFFDPAVDQFFPWINICCSVCPCIDQCVSALQSTPPASLSIIIASFEDAGFSTSVSSSAPWGYEDCWVISLSLFRQYSLMPVILAWDRVAVKVRVIG